MTLFIKLLLAHLIGDFLLQPTRWVIHKEARKVRSGFLYAHILVHFSLILLLLWDLSRWQLALLIAVLHYAIDLGKLYANPLFRYKSIPFFADQFLHLAVLYVCSYHTQLWEHSRMLMGQVNWPLLTAVVFLSFPAAIIMTRLLERMSDQIELDHKSLPNAGKYIGMIERLFVLLFILIGRWDAIGLLITAKSVFRFNDLKASNNRKLTEYILIGTLLSFGIAILTGLVYLSF